MAIQIKNDKSVEYADAHGFMPGVIDVHKTIKSKDTFKVKNNLIVKASYGEDRGSQFVEKLDVTTWLPFAAQKYDISSDIMDYIFIPVFTIPSGLPNRNGVAFPIQALTEFNLDRRMMGYKTFKGCPAHEEHDNEDPTKSQGVIADACLKRLEHYGQGKVWKLLELLEIDRSKYPAIASDYVSGERNSFSMGAMVGYYRCSYCNGIVGKCDHIDTRPGSVNFYEKDGKLVFKEVYDIDGIETSTVRVPAYHVANNDYRLTEKTK
jgi:hypothetical protein